jgi:ribosome-interacting GTPase 1
MMRYLDVSIQLIKNPSLDSEFYDRGITNGADIILAVAEKVEDIEKILEKASSASGKKIIIFTKSDLLNETEKRKINSYLQSKKYIFSIVSSYTEENFKELKEKIFKSFNRIRVYTKEPGKEKSNNPIVLKPKSTIGMVAEKILKGFSKRVIETKIWGPSSKFPGQVVGLKHELRDGDIVEFKTR